MSNINRVFLIVVDSMGCGAAPDAARFGDEGCNTLDTIRRSPAWHCPNLERLGIFHIDGFKPGHKYYLPDPDEGGCCGLYDDDKKPEPEGIYGRLQELSAGKDTTAGHWEIAGLVTEKSFPTFPNGFPKEIIDEFERRTGRGTLVNLPYSGTTVIHDYGEEHMRTGKLIVYTSADSVFQIAAHEDIVPIEELYRYCRIAREMLTGEYGVGRVIARPFTGTCADDFKRVGEHRHDFSILPPKDTMLDVLQQNGLASIGIGKIRDIFAGKGVDERFSDPTEVNVEGMERTIALLKEDWKGLCFVNLVETDSVFGHRRDIEGYAKAVSTFDRQLGELMDGMSDGDVVMITADHGCDPAFKGTDHTREYIPIIAWGKAFKSNVDLGTRVGFGDIAATILDIFGINADTIDGKSWKQAVLK
ncbi:MAG: phosphopentomutase [Lachnospiraceae bacterium]|nr:phosphopentomutase [Lachnospiraceae bacterium]